MFFTIATSLFRGCWPGKTDLASVSFQLSKADRIDRKRQAGGCQLHAITKAGRERATPQHRRAIARTGIPAPHSAGKMADQQLSCGCDINGFPIPFECYRHKSHPGLTSEQSQRTAPAIAMQMARPPRTLEMVCTTLGGLTCSHRCTSKWGVDCSETFIAFCTNGFR